MENKYVPAEIEIIAFDGEDILTGTSQDLPFIPYN